MPAHQRSLLLTRRWMETGMRFFAARPMATIGSFRAILGPSAGRGEIWPLVLGGCQIIQRKNWKKIREWSLIFTVPCHKLNVLIRETD